MGEYYGWIIFVAIISGAICAALCSSLAANKGYENSGSYGLAGFFFGALALIYVSGLPDVKLRKMVETAFADGIVNPNLKRDAFCDSCGTPIVAGSLFCGECGSVVVTKSSKTVKTPSIIRSDELPPL